MAVQPRDIFNIKTKSDFDQIALELFRLHYKHNSTYRSYCDLLFIHPVDIKTVEQIPFLPITFFKSHQVGLDPFESAIVFESSGTTGAKTSKHFVADPKLYRESFTKGFEYFFGSPEDWVILALLPSYLERQHSSLVYMVDHLITLTKNTQSGFYLNTINDLKNTLLSLEKNTTKKIMLIGVSFALLDFVETYKLSLKNTVVIETGGMKGRRRELVKEELHTALCTGFGLTEIYSEYGMTELLSQAYSKGNNVFACPPWMNVFIRDTEDPLSLLATGKTGGLNIIDLANYYSCPFIATQDLGKKRDTDHFEVLGRFDHADIRGCNLLAL